MTYGISALARRYPWSVSKALRTFLLSGTEYVDVDEAPDHGDQTVRRCTYGQEPQVISLVPLAAGGTVEIHGYATFWSPKEVDVAWTDDRGTTYTCWVLASCVRRPAEGEWHGNYFPH